MPSSSSRTTSSGALISFFIWRLLWVGAGSLRPDEVEDDRAQGGAEDGAGELAGQVDGDLVPGEVARRGQAEGDRRVEVGAAERSGGVNADGDRHPPPEGDDDPARVLGLGLGQQDGGDDAVAEQ